MPQDKKARKVIAVNRKARHDYFVDETYEAGISLYGTEVKSVRAGQVNLKDSYCQVENGELYAIGFRISPYEKGNIFNRDPLRRKKLLMHKKEILKLQQLYTGAAFPLFFRRERENGGRAVQGQKAVGQARIGCQSGSRTRDRAVRQEQKSFGSR